MPTDPDLIAILRVSPDPDARVLLQMTDLGANLSTPHEPDFAFELPSSEMAGALATDLSAQGYQVECFDPDEDDSAHQVIAKRTMILNLRTLNKLSVQFEALATKYTGTHDGWGAEIVE